MGTLSSRDRRWVTLTCVALDPAGPIDDQVYAAIETDTIELDALLEFVLHFAVYCGWPKASPLDGAIQNQWLALQQARGIEVPPWPVLDSDALGPIDADERIAGGIRAFTDINLVPAPPGDTPYRHAGILNFVFGHVWQRPGLTRRERRLITVPCVADSGVAIPLTSHVTSALHSGDLTKAEMDEIVREYSAYCGTVKGAALADAVEVAWQRRG